MEISFLQLLRLLKKHIFSILICGLVGLALAFTFTKLFIKPTYVSYVKMFVDFKSSGEQTNMSDLNNLTYIQRMLKSYVEFLKVPSFYDGIATETNLGYTSKELRSMISFSIEDDTMIFKIEVRSQRASDSKAIADAAAGLAPSIIGNIKEEAFVAPLSEAELPGQPSSPSTSKNTVIGLLVGLVLAVIVNLLRELLDTRIKNEEDLSRRYDIPILGVIPDFSGNSRKKRK